MTSHVEQAVRQLLPELAAICVRPSASVPSVPRGMLLSLAGVRFRPLLSLAGCPCSHCWTRSKLSQACRRMPVKCSASPASCAGSRRQ
eukprot:774841-Prymnesium_polylepis.1